MGEENENVGNRPRYPDGTLISDHPSPEEINEHKEFYLQFLQQEELEVLQALKDHQVFKAFKHYARPKNREDAITKAIEWWMKWYPHEVKEFEFYIDRHKQTLANAKGFSHDKAKLQMWQGSIPSTVKQLLKIIDPDFFHVNSKGRSPGYSAFYKVYTKARIGGRHG